MIGSISIISSYWSEKSGVLPCSSDRKSYLKSNEPINGQGSPSNLVLLNKARKIATWHVITLFATRKFEKFTRNGQIGHKCF